MLRLVVLKKSFERLENAEDLPGGGAGLSCI